MEKKVKDIVSKYYTEKDLKKVEIRGGHVMLEILGSPKDTDEKMKKEMYNVGAEKVSLTHAKKA